MTDLKEKSKVQLRETCDVCGLSRGKSAVSMTSWIFGKGSCACAGGESAAASAENVVAASNRQNQDLGERYEILGELGSGGMGTVYKVQDKSTQALFALKVLRSELSQDPEAVKRFESEIKATKAMSHPNMANVYDSGTTIDGNPFFVMDLIEGESLADLLKREKALPLQRAINILLQISDALAYAHEQNIVHRDLKPSNILLSKADSGDDIVKLVDFGIAKILPIQDAETLSLTRTAEIFGSPSYMSPEQCRGDRVDTRSDTYSLGCVFYECLTGAAPFTCDTPVKVLLSQIYDEAPPMRSPLDGQLLPQTAQDVLQTCMQKKVESRYASMKDVHSDLELLRDGKEPKASRSIRLPRNKHKLKLKLFQYSPMISFVTIFLLLYGVLTDPPWFFTISMAGNNKKEAMQSIVDKADPYNLPFALMTKSVFEIKSNPIGAIKDEKKAAELFEQSNRPRNALSCYPQILLLEYKSGQEKSAALDLLHVQHLSDLALRAPPEKGVRLINWFYMPAAIPESEILAIAQACEPFDAQSSKQLLKKLTTDEEPGANNRR